jgi:hypothetical protein
LLRRRIETNLKRCTVGLSYLTAPKCVLLLVLLHCYELDRRIIPSAPSLGLKPWQPVRGKLLPNVKSPEECRAMALLCRQQAPIDPDKHWDLLAQAERWEYLAERNLVDGSYPALRLLHDLHLWN